VAALDVLYFLDGRAERQRREDVILSSAVSHGVITAVQAWPSFFGGPDGAGDLETGLELEKATPESFAADMAALVASSSQVTLREPQQGTPAPVPEHAYVPDPEWT